MQASQYCTSSPAGSGVHAGASSGDHGQAAVATRDSEGRSYLALFAIARDAAWIPLLPSNQLLHRLR